jgi:hypothetical protein
MIKNIFFQISSTLIAISVLAYLVLHTLSSFENELEVKNVYYTTMDLTYDSTAYIFRDETILNSTQSGFAIYDTENGKKVKINQKVATIYQDSSVYDSNVKIKALDKKISHLERMLNEVVYSTPSIPSLDKSVNNRVNQVAVYSSEGNLNHAITLTDESIYDLEMKYCILNGTDAHKELLNSYKTERSILMNSSNGASTSVTSPVSGYFYNVTDGYESYFTFDAIENLSSASFEELKNTKPLSVDDSVGKIVENSRWYIAFELKTSDAINLSQNQKYNVYFPSSDKSVQMKVEKRVDSSTDEKKIIVMSSNSIYDNFNFSRKQNISVTSATFSGLAFPVSAVHTDFDSTGASKAGVYVLDETIVKFKTFNKIMEKNGYVLCSVPDSKNISAISKTEVSLFDCIITEGTNLYHNKVIKNVLTAN